MSTAMKKGFAVCVLCLLVCGAVVACNGLMHVNETEGTPGSDPRGDWVQTSCYVIDDGVKMNDVHEENELYIDDYGDHYAKCTLRGEDFIAVCMGNLLIWNFVSEYGTDHGEVMIYEDCLVVNEILYKASGKAFVSASLYTRDGETPDWFSYYGGGVSHLKWSLSSANSMSTDGLETIDGRSLYFTLFHGPAFTAEMEQDGGDGIVTSKLSGMVIGEGDDGAFSAITVDESGNIWHMFYNGSTMSLESVITDSMRLGGGAACVERNYEEISDSAFPVYSEGVMTSGDAWHFESAHAVTWSGIDDLDIDGRFTVSMTEDQLFTMTVAGNPDMLAFIGYTMPMMSNPDIHFVGMGVYDSAVRGLDSAYGIYDSALGEIHFYWFTEDSEGCSIVVEYVLSCAQG